MYKARMNEEWKHDSTVYFCEKTIGNFWKIKDNYVRSKWQHKQEQSLFKCIKAQWRQPKIENSMPRESGDVKPKKIKVELTHGTGLIGNCLESIEERE